MRTCFERSLTDHRSVDDEPHVYQPMPEEVAETEAFLGRRAMLDAIDGEPLNGGAAIAKAAFGSAGFLFALHLA